MPRVNVRRKDTPTGEQPRGRIQRRHGRGGRRRHRLVAAGQKAQIEHDRCHLSPEFQRGEEPGKLPFHMLMARPHQPDAPEQPLRRQPIPRGRERGFLHVEGRYKAALPHLPGQKDGVVPVAGGRAHGKRKGRDAVPAFWQGPGFKSPRHGPVSDFRQRRKAHRPLTHEPPRSLPAWIRGTSGTTRSKLNGSCSSLSTLSCSH